ncbi:MAG: O-antigen ligase family protein [Chloroflexota bacterium]|nr:O-antigen ligase family protein [Chloroflexota bacterium]
MGVALVCAKVALVPVVFDYSADFPFPVAKALVSHALAYAVAGVILALAVQFGRSLVVWSWIHVPVVVFLAANGVATVFAPDRQVALYGTHARMLGLGTMADFVLLYFAVVLLVRTRADAIATIASGLAASVAVFGYELMQLLSKDPFDWRVNGTERPFSTLGQTTTLAEYLAILGVGAIALALLEPRLRVPLRAALVGYGLLLVAGMLVTQTRSALIGIVAGAALLVALTWLGHPSRRARVISLIGAMASAGVIILVLVFTPVGARVLATVETAGVDVTGDPTGLRLEQSADTRIGLYIASLQMLRDRPLIGYGPDNFSAAFPRYRSESEPAEIQESLPTSAHSWAAQIAATSGLLGLGAFVGIVVLVIVMTVRVSFRPVAWMAAAMLAAFVGAGITSISDVGTDWLFWASAGAVAVATGRRWDVALAAPVEKRRRPPRAVPRWTNIRSLVAFACVAVGLGLMLTVFFALAASRSARDSQLQRLAGQPQLAVTSALHATSGDPGRPEYWHTLGLAYIAAQRTSDAIQAFDHAVSLQPYSVRFLGDLTSAHLLLIQRGVTSSSARAREVADRAVRADPNNPQANLTRAIAMQVTGNLAEAARSVQRALELDPRANNPRIYLTATQILLADGRPNDAIAMGRRAIGALYPQDTVQIRIELARALLAAGDPAQAFTELNNALAIQPNEPVALQLRAQIEAGLPRQ